MISVVAEDLDLANRKIDGFRRGGRYELILGERTVAGLTLKFRLQLRDDFLRSLIADFHGDAANVERVAIPMLMRCVP